MCNCFLPSYSYSKFYSFGFCSMSSYIGSCEKPLTFTKKPLNTNTVIYASLKIVWIICIIPQIYKSGHFIESQCIACKYTYSSVIFVAGEIIFWIGNGAVVNQFF